MNYTSASYKLDKMTNLVVRTVVDRKEGKLYSPDAEMVKATIEKYHAMCKALATNTDIDEEAEWPEVEVIECDDYRVQIFGDVNVTLPTGEYYASVPMFSEYTDPRETVDLMREMMRGVWGAGLLPDGGNTNGNGKLAHTAEEWQQAADDNGAVDLAQQFPRQDAPAGTNSTDTTNSGNHIALFDYKQQEAYEAKYEGQVITVDVSQIANVYDVKKNGTGAYQIFKFYPFYTGNSGDVVPSAYPAHALNTFPPRKEDQWSWSGYKELRALVPEAGDAVEGHFVCKYKVNKIADGRVFWNLQGIEALGDFERTGTNSAADDDFDELPEGLSEADIPF